MTRKTTLHFQNIRYANNAGIPVAECVARREGPLDCEAPESQSATSRVEDVTCARCAAALRKDDGFGGRLAARLPKIASRHGNEQYRWSEQILSQIRDLLMMARSCHMTQAEYLDRRGKILASPAYARLSSTSQSYVSGYMRAIEDAQRNALIHVQRIVGKPETASSTKWDAMTEDLRQACRDHNVESCLAWDDRGEFPYGPWTHS